MTCLFRIYGRVPWHPKNSIIIIIKPMLYLTYFRKFITLLYKLQEDNTCRDRNLLILMLQKFEPNNKNLLLRMKNFSFRLRNFGHYQKKIYNF